MMRRNFLRVFPLLLALLVEAAPAGAENPGVRNAVNAFMRTHSKKLVEQYGSNARIEYTIALPDVQLAMSDCAVPLALTAKDAGQLSSRISVQVSCPNSWSIYVPIDLAIYRPVVIAVKPLAAGSTIGSDDVQMTEVDITQLLGQYLTDLDDAIGMSAKRPLSAGRPVVAQQLTPPLLIRRGESVVINAESNAISVKMPGIALSDGRRGEQIRIKNPGSSRVIEARVTGPGQVQAPM